MLVDDKPFTTLLYGNGPGGTVSGPRQNLTSVNTTTTDYLQQAAVPLDQETHAGEDVPLYATGPMSHLFSGTLEQNVIPHIMAYASCVGANLDHCERTTNENDVSSANPVVTNTCLLYFALIVSCVLIL